jgi:hemerythrin-like metal-binding protein
MALFVWGPQYELGLPEMDTQHRRWVDLLNQVYEGLSKGQSPDLQALLGECVHYTELHFAAEEAFMLKHGYPNLPEHARQHAEFATRMSGLLGDVQSGTLKLSLPVTTEMKTWLTHHIQKEDRRYAEYILRKQAQQ